MNNHYLSFNFSSLTNLTVNRQPDAKAYIKGDSKHPQINGTTYFYQTDYGVLLISEISGLPHKNESCKNAVYAYHIHSGEECSGNMSDHFSNAMSHYNPNNCPHPAHSGDLPPLFENNGYAFMAFITDRFTVKEILSKTIIIHSNADDFSTQPSGNSGSKIACGVIIP